MRISHIRLTSALLALAALLTVGLSACGTDPEGTPSAAESSQASQPGESTQAPDGTGDPEKTGETEPSSASGTGASQPGKVTQKPEASKGQVLKPNANKGTSAVSKSTAKPTLAVKQEVRNDYTINTPQEKQFESLKGSTLRIVLDPSTLLEGSQDDILIKYVQKKYGVKIDYLKMGYEEAKSKIGQMVAAGNPPDALLIYESNFLQWAYRNILQPIDKYMVEDSTWSGVSRTYFRTNNKTYGITYGNPETDLFTYMIFYNKTLFEEQNVQDPYELYQKDQWTMNKLVETAKKMTLFREDGKTVKTYGFSTWAPTYFMLANGGTGIKEDRGVFKSTIKEAPEMGGLNVFYQMCQDRSFGMGIDPYVGFGNRTIAMHFEMPGNAIFQHDYYNTMDDEIGMVPMPKADDGKYYSIVMEYGFAVPRNAKNPLGGVMFAYEQYQLNNGRLINNPSAYDLDNRRKTLSDAHLKIMQDYYKKATMRVNWMEGLSGWQEGGISKKFWDKITTEKLPPSAAVDAMEGLLKSAIKQTTG